MSLKSTTLLSIISIMMLPACGSEDEPTETTATTTSSTTSNTSTTTGTTTTGTTTTGTTTTSTTTGTTTTSTTTGTTTTTTTTPKPENLLADGGFEAYDSDKAGTALLSFDWLVYPGDNPAYAVLLTGAEMYNSADLFEAPEGSAGLKTYGPWWGWPAELSIFQEWANPTEGSSFTFSGWGYHHADDPLTVAHTYGELGIKFFDDSWNLLGHDKSDRIDFNTATNSWTELSVTSTVPAGATLMQAAITQWQCDPAEGADESGNCWDGNGAAYWDQLSFVANE